MLSSFCWAWRGGGGGGEKGEGRVKGRGPTGQGRLGSAHGAHEDQRARGPLIPGNSLTSDTTWPVNK
eukprot:5234895-Pyramimonas_sp.AAC.1